MLSCLEGNLRQNTDPLPLTNFWERTPLSLSSESHSRGISRRTFRCFGHISWGKPLGAPETAGAIMISFYIKTKLHLDQKNGLFTFTSRYGRMFFIQLLVLRNRRQWLLAAILRSGYVKILILTSFQFSDSLVWFFEIPGGELRIQKSPAPFLAAGRKSLESFDSPRINPCRVVHNSRTVGDSEPRTSSH